MAKKAATDVVIRVSAKTVATRALAIQGTRALAIAAAAKVAPLAAGSAIAGPMGWALTGVSFLVTAYTLWHATAFLDDEEAQAAEVDPKDLQNAVDGATKKREKMTGEELNTEDTAIVLGIFDLTDAPSLDSTLKAASKFQSRSGAGLLPTMTGPELLELIYKKPRQARKLIKTLQGEEFYPDFERVVNAVNPKALSGGRTGRSSGGSFSTARFCRAAVRAVPGSKTCRVATAEIQKALVNAGFSVSKEGGTFPWGMNAGASQPPVPGAFRGSFQRDPTLNMQAGGKPLNPLAAADDDQDPMIQEAQNPPGDQFSAEDMKKYQIDGRLGPKTIAAIENFQKAVIKQSKTKGVELPLGNSGKGKDGVDGLVGGKTWKFLSKYKAVKAPRKSIKKGAEIFGKMAKAAQAEGSLAVKRSAIFDELNQADASPARATFKMIGVISKVARSEKKVAKAIFDEFESKFGKFNDADAFGPTASKKITREALPKLQKLTGVKSISERSLIGLTRIEAAALIMKNLRRRRGF